VALAWLAPLLLGFVLRPLTGVPWWQFVPLGLVECALAITEVAAVVVLGWWAWRAAGVTTPTPIPADLSVRAGAGKPEPCHRFRISR
jgi:hypothetical protein